MRNVHYCPLVLDANRSTFEAAIRNEYNISSFQIREAIDDPTAYDVYLPRRKRPEYLPKIVAAKGPFDFAAVGFDLYSEPGRTEATNRARASNALIATEPVRLLNTPWYGLVLVAPTYESVHPRGALESAVVPGQPLTAAQWSGLRFSGVLAAGIILSEPMASVAGQTQGVDALLLEDVTALVNRTYGTPSLWVPCPDASATNGSAMQLNGTVLGTPAANLARSSVCTASLRNRCGFVCPVASARGFGGGLLVSAVRVSAANVTKIGFAGSAADNGAMPFASGGSSLGVSISNVAATFAAELNAREAAAMNDAAASVDRELVASLLFSVGGRSFSFTVVGNSEMILGASRLVYSLIVGSACAVGVVLAFIAAALLYWRAEKERQRQVEHKQREAVVKQEVQEQMMAMLSHEVRRDTDAGGLGRGLRCAAVIATELCCACGCLPRPRAFARSSVASARLTRPRACARTVTASLPHCVVMNPRGVFVHPLRPRVSPRLLLLTPVSACRAPSHSARLPAVPLFAADSEPRACDQPRL
jgi:hypothetical protein